MNAWTQCSRYTRIRKCDSETEQERVLPMYTYDAWQWIHAHELEMSCLFFPPLLSLFQTTRGLITHGGGEGFTAKVIKQVPSRSDHFKIVCRRLASQQTNQAVSRSGTWCATFAWTFSIDTSFYSSHNMCSHFLFWNVNIIVLIFKEVYDFLLSWLFFGSSDGEDLIPNFFHLWPKRLSRTVARLPLKKPSSHNIWRRMNSVINQ